MATVRDRGRMGGLQTKLRHSPDYYSRIGKLGGRPKVNSVIVPSEFERRRIATDSNSLKKLKALWREKEGELQLTH